jgi:hypothetical protein
LLQRFAVKLNRNTIGTVAIAQEVFSVRSMTDDAGGSITVQTAVGILRKLRKLASKNTQ